MNDPTIREFVESLAARTATPGGGAAAAVAAAMGAGLLAMAARFAQGKRHTVEDAEQLLARAIELLDARRALMLPMAERDAAAFGLVTEAYRLPKASDPERAIRDRAIQTALLGAMAVPEEAMCLIRDVLRDFEPVLPLIGRNIVSDVGSGTALLEAAAKMARLNVQINVSYLHDRDRAIAATQRVTEVAVEIGERAERIRHAVDRLLAQS